MIDFMIISFIIGFLRKGNLKGLSEIPLRRLEIIFASFIIRYMPLFLKGSLKEFASNHIIAISIISYTLLLCGLFSNWHIKPLRPVAIGVFLNFLVIVANGGKMPVSLWAVDAAGLQDYKADLFNPDYLYHTALTPSTRLAILGDIIPLPRPYPNPRVFSIGDLLMAAGVFILIQEAMLKKMSSSGKIKGR
ncbi:conserved hypothetical protein [Thermosediminibacter oceani DSM 16646]|uniref:DUF5317 domain-containing protein n=1 Tax=Thermosediminibacter oceani (strain ATCC BAA-1034 / DSM 16646 / JW/IW-1228P) TaxID=555079 RepID=D9RYM2_THEOJ|nr:conserved hypothetical protein [Thermosediminibacter oceani DSM 16646]